MSEVTVSCFVWRPKRGGWTLEIADVELESELLACSEESLLSTVRAALHLVDEELDRVELTDGMHSIHLEPNLQLV